LYFLDFWYSLTSFSYFAFNFLAFSAYLDCSDSSRSRHMLPTSFSTSVTPMSGLSATTSTRTSFTKIMYPESGRLGAFLSFLNGFFFSLALYSSRAFWCFFQLELPTYFSFFFMYAAFRVAAWLT